MSSGVRLVGVVAAVRIQAALLLPVSLVSCVPAVTGGAHRFTPVATAGMAAVLFVSTFGALLNNRRPWYRSRLERLTAPGPDADVVALDRTFDLYSRSMTVPLVMVLLVGLVVCYSTGVPIGMAVAGIAGGMLWLSGRLAAQERLLGGWIVGPHMPVRTTTADPNYAVYRESRFYLVRDASS
ncbi:hypothetical protein OG871_22730 [Kitasatospora sp. NBC_00374]|uniref:hypothetical protein n=1 Tax=Kitasatospora sp. NBC_00374 TaxID=2975964 RepID=UPI003246BCAA